MNWQDIKVSEDSTYFMHNGEQVFDKKFLEVLKFHAPGLAPVKDQTGAYHITVEGEQLYENRHDRTFGFYCNRAAVVSNGQSFHVTEMGERAYSDSFAWCGNYQEDLCTVRDVDGSYYHIDKCGSRAYSENYLYSGDYKDGYACVQQGKGQFFHIDRQGKPMYDKRFHDLGVFHKGFATARDEKGWFHINKQGEGLYDERYLYLEPFYNGYSLATTTDMEKVVIDEEGNVSIKIC